MKAISKFIDLRAYVAFVIIAMLLVSCNPKDKENIPTPVVVIKTATNETYTSVTMNISVIPYEIGAKVKFEITKKGQQNWTVQPVVLNFSNSTKLNDSVKATFDIMSLEKGTEYTLRATPSNAAGTSKVVENNFSTIAVSDVDSNKYHQVKIGNQIWLKENLRTTHYQNGDPISNEQDPQAWWNLKTGGYVWCQNDENLGKVYGALYNFYAVLDSRGLAMKGWHIPTYEEWFELKTFLKNDIAKKLMEQGTAHWGVTSANPTNASGFTALPAGEFGERGTDKTLGFMDFKTDASFWTTYCMGTSAQIANLSNARLNFELNLLINLSYGLSVRAVKNKL